MKKILRKVMSIFKPKLYKQGNDGFFGKQKMIGVHLEFSNVCNRKCSYCIQDNGYTKNVPSSLSNTDDMLLAIDKIFNVVDENDFLYFILVGGEPTLQPALKPVIEKIKTRKNTTCLITTNLTQSVEYYKELDIPIIASFHLEDTCLESYLEKVENLKDLMAHVRLMAQQHMFPVVKEMYDRLLILNKDHHIDFAVEKLMSFSLGDGVASKAEQDGYTGNHIEYDPKELQQIEKMGWHNAEYPEYLKDKLGVLPSLFYKANWWYKTRKNILCENMGENRFRGMYCERSFLVITETGELLIAWCHDPKINIFESQAELPKSLFETVICPHKSCPGGFITNVPKYKYLKDAPLYKNIERT